jgi:prephenate dehydrogenase
MKGFNKILIIGLGLIGGSFAKAIRAKMPDVDVIGIDVQPQVIAVAKSKGLIRDGIALGGNGNAECKRNADAAQCGESAIMDLLANGRIDLIVMAVPVAAYDVWFLRISDSGFKGIVTDVGSTKKRVAQCAADRLRHPEYFVPGHPMAGSENSGIDAARSDLFDGAYWILTPTELTDTNIYRRLHGLLSSIGARVISTDPADHDQAIAVVSHAPHVAAAALVLLAEKHAGDKGDLLRFAAGGFKDTTRIAAANPDLWTGILFDNTEIVAAAVDELAEILSDFSAHIRQGDRDGIRHLLASAAGVRTSLPTRWSPNSATLFEVSIPMDNRPGIIAEITSSAGKACCNIQSIEIDHQTDDRAILRLVLTDEGDLEEFINALKGSGFKPHVKAIRLGKH